MSVVRSSVATLGLRQTLGNFFAWWKSELAAMTPALLRDSSQLTDNLLLILASDEGAGLLWRRHGKWSALGRVQSDSRPEETKRLLSAANIGTRTTIVRLSATSGLRRRLELPIAAEQDLHQVISYQLDALSPYPANQVYFDQKIVSRDFENGKLQVELFLAPRDVVDKQVEQAAKWGLTADVVDFVADDEMALPAINLLPTALLPDKPPALLSRFNLLLLVVNLVLLATLAAIHLLDKAEREAELQTRVETAKLRADAAIKLRQQVDKLNQESAALQTTSQRSLPALTVLNELTRILPDGTWLDRAVLSSGEINLYGLSSKASTLISEVEKSPLFENVDFEAPVVQDNRKGGERFQISASITLPDTDD